MRRQSRQGLRILCDTRDAAALAPVLEDPDAWFARATGRDVLKHDRTTSVIRITVLDRCYILKRYNTKDPWHAFRRLFRRSRAMNCWVMAQRFLDAGIPTARPAAVIQERWGPLALRSYFISESLAGLSLPEALRLRPETAPGIAGRMRGMFHALGKNRLTHGDFKATNILVAPNGELYLIDLDAAHRVRLGVSRRRAWLRDRARFLRNFENDPALDAIFRQAIPEGMYPAGS